jgi:uncharacterized protein
MDEFVIDAFEFSRLKERREGDVAISRLTRLVAETAGQAAASLHYSVLGGADAYGHPQLLLSVSGTVSLLCQRCMTPFDFAIASESAVLLARTDVHADEIEAGLEDEAVDVIVAAKALNLLELIEDEALLALPLAPKHDVCPGHVALDELKSAKKPSPFDVLKDLKQGS